MQTAMPVLWEQDSSCETSYVENFPKLEDPETYKHHQRYLNKDMNGCRQEHVLIKRKI